MEGGAPAPLFAKTKTAEVWVLLIEKAFAKRVGSYSALQGGIAPVAWVALTGCEEQQIWKRDAAGRWTKGILDMDALRGDIAKSNVGFYTTTDHRAPSEMLAFLKDCDERNFVMVGAPRRVACCSATCCPAPCGTVPVARVPEELLTLRLTADAAAEG